MSKPKQAIVLFVLSICLIPSTLFTQVIPDPEPQLTSAFVKTIQVDALWPGGELNLGLTGANYNKVGIWFSSSSSPFNHTEFGNRLLSGDGYSDSADNHETATAGIIIAEGKNNLARGMAYQASLKAFNSKAGLAELATQANDGLEISSHSFATLPYYSFADSIEDAIAYEAPQFLKFQAGGPCEPFLEIEGVSGQGKNSISVGSVQAMRPPYSNPENIISAGTGSGPAFDGRIKPDLVAAGGPGLFCNIIDDYTSTGAATSYAAPAAAGASVLLQQHYQNTHNKTPMLSSELKGLLVHTAEEAGPAPGPDSEFGWGLINAKRAAQLITNDVDKPEVISSKLLSEGDEFEKEIYSDGTQPLRVTICWIDPPGEFGSPTTPYYYVDPSPRLVNDLDLKIIKGTTYFPWTLNTVDPALAANNNFKNHLDNVEQVYIPSPTEGWHTIQINHDGSLTNGLQLFSLIVTGDTENLTPRALKLKVLDELQSSYSTEDKSVDKELQKAIESIGESLNAEYWIDDFYLTSNGNKVFVEEKKAVKALEKIIKEGTIFDQEIYGAIMDLLDVDKDLAQIMIDKAIEYGGDNSYIEKAIEEMERAQDKLINGSEEDNDEEDEDDNEDDYIYENDNYDDIVYNYKKAWQWAYKALEEVGLAKISDSTEDVVVALVSKDTGFRLGDNYPNPFNPTTEISYQVPEPSEVHITIYNLLGERIAQLVNEHKDVGNYTVRWNGTDSMGNQVSNSVYLYELRSGNFKQVKRMSFIK